MRDPAGQLARIAQAHFPVTHPMTGAPGYCNECGWRWPCPTYRWATMDMELLGHWYQEGEPT